MIKDIVIIGAGDLAKEVALLIEYINKKEEAWNLLGFIDSNESNIGLKNGKIPIFNSDSWVLENNNNLNVAFGIGNPEKIRELAKLFIQNKNLYFPNLIHPNIEADWDRIEMGQGNIIRSGCSIIPPIKIGSFNFVNVGCIIGHDVSIGNYNLLNVNTILSGNVSIQDTNLFGSGSIIIQGAKICSNCKIGLGSVVLTDISEKGTYFGMPAKLLRHFSK